MVVVDAIVLMAMFLIILFVFWVIFGIAFFMLFEIFILTTGKGRELQKKLIHYYVEISKIIGIDAKSKN